jgi:hypothetical protein
MIINPSRFAAAGDIKTDLVAFWNLGEASGTRVDAHSTYDLTEDGTIGSVTGVVGVAANHAANNSDSLYHPDDAAFDVTGDLTVAGWINSSSLSGSCAIIGKINGSGVDERSYLLYRSLDKLRFLVCSDGTSGGNTIVESTASISTSTWYFVVGVFKANDVVELWVDGASAVTPVSAPALLHSGTARLELFSFNEGTISTPPAYLDQVAIWSRALSTSEISTLYNSGSGVAYADL